MQTETTVEKKGNGKGRKTIGDKTSELVAGRDADLTKVDILSIYNSLPQKAEWIVTVGGNHLICNEFNHKSQQEMLDNQKGEKKITKKPPRNKEEEFNGARILNHRGQDCAKAIWFKMAMLQELASRGRGLKTDIQQRLYVVGLKDPDLCELTFDGDEMAGKKHIPTCREDVVRVGKFPNKVAMVRWRPAYNNWSCQFKITVETDALTPQQVMDLLIGAGRHGGVGEWRPGKCASGFAGLFEPLTMSDIQLVKTRFKPAMKG